MRLLSRHVHQLAELEDLLEDTCARGYALQDLHLDGDYTVAVLSPAPASEDRYRLLRGHRQDLHRLEEEAERLQDQGYALKRSDARGDFVVLLLAAASERR